MTVEDWSVMRTTLAMIRTDFDDAAGKGAALGDDHVALLDPVIGALADRDEATELRRLAGDHLRGRRLVREAIAQLEDAREELDLALGFEKPQVFGLEALVLAAQGGIVSVQPVDVRHGLEDPGDALGHVVHGALDRTNGITDGALELSNERVRREGHHHERRGDQRDEHDRAAAGGPGCEQGTHESILTLS